MTLSKKRSLSKKAMKRSSSKKRKSSRVKRKSSSVKRKSSRVRRKSRSRVMKGGSGSNNTKPNELKKITQKIPNNTMIIEQKVPPNIKPKKKKSINPLTE